MAEFTSKSYFDFLEEGRIMGSKCMSCGTVHLPPRPICHDCGATEMEWTELGGEGVVQAVTVINVPLSKMEGRCPYAVAVVKLDDCPSISGLVHGVKEGGELSIGDRVVAEFVKEGDKTTLCFRSS
ncbi:MAG: Zn-ribbon domain-containing OB-fold protein [Candidatus Bathyarchaeota archaeon]|nr:MAG: Zn-ribbon domain-containing OB-fold protein [Candidatus Bathyarchaeota archaeon]